MATLIDHRLINHLASVARIRPKWALEVLRHLCVCDITGLVAAEVARVAKSNARRKNNRPDLERPECDPAELGRQIASGGHNLFATKFLRPAIHESISLTLWRALVTQAHREDLLAVVAEEFECGSEANQSKAAPSKESKFLKTQRRIAELLGADKTTIERWKTNRTIPDGNKVLGAALVALQVEISDCKFGTRSRILKNAVLRTITLIEGGHFSAKSGSRPKTYVTNDTLYAVRLFHRHKHSACFLPNPDESSERLQAALLLDLSQSLKQVLPKSQIWQVEILRKVIGRWAMPYALFRIGLVSGWPNGTEDEWSWRHIG